MFVNPSNQPPQSYHPNPTLQLQLAYQNNQYLFLRSIWKTHSHQFNHVEVSLDDQLDRLNKIVAMMKKHINSSTTRQLEYQNNNTYNYISIREAKALEQMNKAMQQIEDYRGKLINIQNKNQQLHKNNEELKQEILFLQKQKKENQKLIKQLSQKNANLQNKILFADYMEQKITKNSIVRSPDHYNWQSNVLDETKSFTSISENTIIQNCQHHSHIDKLNDGNNNPHSTQDQLDKLQNLNQQLMVQSSLKNVALSMSRYGFISDKPQPIQNYFSHKQNIQDYFHMQKHESQKNLSINTRQKNIKNILKLSKRQEHLVKESAKKKIKFIRQNNNKSSILRLSQKVNQSITDSNIQEIS